MAKILISLFLFCHACAEVFKLPAEFFVTERLIALTSTFDIADASITMAKATKRCFALTSAYDLENADSQPMAKATARFFSWGTIADVTDSEGRKIGCIEENLWKILPWAQYRIFNAENQLVAIATMNFCGTYFTLHDPDFSERVFAIMSRPFIRCCRDAWTVQIVDKEIFEKGWVDPRLLVLLAIYQTDKENRARFYREVYQAIERDLKDQ